VNDKQQVECHPLRRGETEAGPRDPVVAVNCGATDRQPATADDAGLQGDQRFHWILRTGECHAAQRGADLPVMTADGANASPAAVQYNSWVCATASERFHLADGH
jgi:hypothetical protein